MRTPRIHHTQTFDNLKKSSTDKISAIEVKLNTLYTNWEKFESHQDHIVALRRLDIVSDHEYTKSDYSIQEENYLMQKGVFLDLLQPVQHCF